MHNTDLRSVGEQLKLHQEIGVLTSGRSMRPMLRQHRDLVIIKRVDRKLRKGDVVVYLGTKDDFVLHRIMRYSKDGSYIIRDDNNYFTEYGIFDKDIVGVLKEFYRDGKYVSCEKSKGYKLYVFWIMHSYWLRCIWKKVLLPFLVKVKHFLIRKK